VKTAEIGVIAADPARRVAMAALAALVARGAIVRPAANVAARVPKAAVARARTVVAVADRPVRAEISTEVNVARRRRRCRK